MTRTLDPVLNGDVDAWLDRFHDDMISMEERLDARLDSRLRAETNRVILSVYATGVTTILVCLLIVRLS